jgi:tryptophanyl-tRNA synthetase
MSEILSQKTQPAGSSTEAPKRPVILSGIQPSGQLMIGNYSGALKNWIALQEDHECYYMLVDLHAITVYQKPADLRKRCYEFLALYMACGLDPERNTLFVQSHVPQHAELAWILNCITPLGQLQRMTQFKEKARKNEKNLNAGLLNYPVLMAADILLYNADKVPVGADQKQHLELARDLAERFNYMYSDTFTVPDPWIPSKSDGARIMSLQEPTAKMSKSDIDPNATLALLDRPDQVKSKLKRAVTDSESSIAYDPDNRPGVSNLMTIFRLVTGESFESQTERFAGKGYGPFKAELIDAVVAYLDPIQARYKVISSDKKALDQILADGAEKAQHRARRILSKVYRKVGFIQPKR